MKKQPNKLPDDVIILDENIEINKKKQPNKLPDDVIILDEEPTQSSSSVAVVTEDTGKIFEMGICLAYNIPFDGKYKYSMNEGYIIKDKLTKLPEIFPYQLKHTAKNGSQYDFTCITDDTIKLSAKTTKKDGKVCPQVIGQPSKQKFCKFFGIDIDTTDSTINLESKIKQYIQNNVYSMLTTYFDYTFDCPIIYFNKHKNSLLFIEQDQTNKINWNNYLLEFSHIKKNKLWGESSTISIDNKSIGEFQVHNNRNCVKFRWAFENVLKIFKQHFKIISL